MKTLKRSYQNPIPVDDDVKVLQRYLNYVRSKYHCSWVYLDQIDGQFGKDTDAAVRAFQTFANIKVDVVGIAACVGEIQLLGNFTFPIDIHRCASACCYKQNGDEIYVLH